MEFILFFLKFPSFCCLYFLLLLLFPHFYNYLVLFFFDFEVKNTGKFSYNTFTDILKFFSFSSLIQKYFFNAAYFRNLSLFKKEKPKNCLQQKTGHISYIPCFYIFSFSIFSVFYFLSFLFSRFFPGAAGGRPHICR